MANQKNELKITAPVPNVLKPYIENILKAKTSIEHGPSATYFELEQALPILNETLLCRDKNDDRNISRQEFWEGLAALVKRSPGKAHKLSGDELQAFRMAKFLATLSAEVFPLFTTTRLVNPKTAPRLTAKLRKHADEMKALFKRSGGMTVDDFLSCNKWVLPKTIVPARSLASRPLDDLVDGVVKTFEVTLSRREADRPGKGVRGERRRRIQAVIKTHFRSGSPKVAEALVELWTVRR